MIKKYEVKKYQSTFEITNSKPEKNKILISNQIHSRYLYWNDRLNNSEYLKTM